MSNGSSSESSLIFELTPSNEGFYFCRSGNEVSNMKEIVGTYRQVYLDGEH